MKALFWQCTLITTLCLAAQCIASSYDNSKYLQEKYFSPKRTKPSLSIVNPLDVLRQRVMLEMARRQRENANKQAEINKEILKSIGKRGNSIDYNDIEEYLRNRYYDTARLYAPLYESKERVAAASRNERHKQQAIVPGQSTKLNEKVANEQKASSEALNDPNQEQIYVVDDSRNNGIDDSRNNGIDEDDDSQIKYLYSLYKSRLSNNI